MYDGNLSYITR